MNDVAYCSKCNSLRPVNVIYKKLKIIDRRGAFKSVSKINVCKVCGQKDLPVKMINR
jgi:hypothetical protein